MEIRRATPNDQDVLFDIWLRSVRATHTFVSEADLESFMPLVRDYLASSVTERVASSSMDGPSWTETVGRTPSSTCDSRRQP